MRQPSSYCFFLSTFLLLGGPTIVTSRCIGLASPATSAWPTSPAAIALLDPNQKNRYSFGYRIRIENLTTNQHVQLLGRHWHIQEIGPDEEGEDFKSEYSTPPIVVDAPTTGAGAYHQSKTQKTNREREIFLIIGFP